MRKPDRAIGPQAAIINKSTCAFQQSVALFLSHNDLRYHHPKSDSGVLPSTVSSIHFIQGCQLPVMVFKNCASCIQATCDSAWLSLWSSAALALTFALALLFKSWSTVPSRVSHFLVISRQLLWFNSLSSLSSSDWHVLYLSLAS